MSEHDPEREAAERERLAQIRAEVDATFAEIRESSVDRPRDILIPAVLGAIFGLVISGVALIMVRMI